MKYTDVTLILPAKGHDVKTAKWLEAEATPHVQVIIVPINLLYGEAIKWGVSLVQTPLVATMDADGQHTLEDLLHVLRHQASTRADMVIGARPGVWNPRGAASQLLNLTASILTGHRVRDFGSGCRVFRADHYRRLSLPDGFDHNAALTLGFLTDRQDVRWVTIPRRDRLHGRSFVRPVDGLKTLRTIVRSAHGK